jgi:hypothetical protein
MISEDDYIEQEEIDEQVERELQELPDPNSGEV